MFTLNNPLDQPKENHHKGMLKKIKNVQHSDHLRKMSTQSEYDLPD